MRILEVTDCYPPPLVGGRDLMVQLLTRELANRGHEVEVVTLAGSRGGRTEHDGAVTIHRLEGWSRVLASRYADPDKPFHPTIPDPGLVVSLRRILKDRRPQIVHAHSWFLYSLLPLLPSADTKLVVWVHDQGFICATTTYLHRGRACSGPSYGKCVACSSRQYGRARGLALTTGLRAMGPWRQRVDRYVANSRATAAASAPMLGPLDVIPPFVPDAAFDAPTAPRPSFVPPDGDYLMFAGALGAHKGLDVLLQAWGELRNRPPLVLAGLRRLDTPASFPDGVMVAEDVPHEDVLRAWGHCVAAVVPSVWPEPFGAVALEAMAARRPVIASAVGGLADLVIDGTTGLHVPPGDVSALRSALESMIADPPLRDRLGAAGRERAREYSLDVVVDAWERVFAELIDGD